MHDTVLAKNFQTDISAFAHIPAEELFIFPARKFQLLFTAIISVNPF